MPNLILIKHASPQVDPDSPPEEWPLSDEGRRRAEVLAEKIAPHLPDIVISSEERKARETAEIIAAKLGVTLQTAPDLHEHDRSTVSHMRSGEFISMIELMLRKPDELVLGEETASAALQRFERAVGRIVEAHPNQTITIVSHGTVIAMFLAQHSHQPAFALWRQMGLPSYAVLALPKLDLVELVPRVD